jgi:Domain of unknown function (DUF4397)
MKPLKKDLSGLLMMKSRQLNLPELAMAALLSLVLACGLSACQNVATYTQPTVVRVIDASYMAPAINVNLDGTLFAANIGQGTFTNYATLAGRSGALIAVTPVAGGAPLISTNGTFLPGQQYSILLTDNGQTPATYSISFLNDQRTLAAQGHSAFRFINQGLMTGAIDIYVIPDGVNLANAIPVVTNLAVGSVSNYISFESQTVRLFITAAGGSKALYKSLAINLTGGEVRTVLIVDTQLTTNPPLTTFIGSDVD